MTMSRSPKQPPRPSLPMIAATTAALPAVVLSSLALAQPALAHQPAKSLPATLTAAMNAQAAAKAKATATVIPASSVSTTIPAAFKPAQNSAPAEYTVARGDTISAIAGKFNLNTGEVLRLNNLQANTIIYPGQKIKLSGSPAAAAPAPAAPAAAPASAAGATYTVKPGDTLGAVAARHNVSLGDVFSWNNLNMRSIIYPGQKIKVGAGSQAPAAPAAAAAPAASLANTSAPQAPAAGSYTVKAGDTLSAIASRHGVKLPELLSANGLNLGSIIYPGNKLNVPGSGSQPAAAQPAAPAAPLVPSSFLGFTYPPAVVSSANENKALLNASPVPSRAEMQNIVADTARRMGVEPSLALAFAYQESGFNQRAVSPANAIGTMQVIPSSGKWASDLVGRKLNLLDPYDNATAGVAIIRQLLATSKDRDTAIAGYYQGQYSVSKYGMYDDTKAYVAAIKAHQKNFG
ncbi:LysM peptidoglycan-binding domain-containing protein [Pseudarthrobacter sp. SL88]|uniref:lytic transglycosylase domain-containing protein n=1 Tax=Pseudarthrobacter sp. SL88 TaxID=2994666 RepID=UPI0022761DB9|nr:lytic transglycosylase domain-containing protein [Pseudarthrobacter sp. SL88]MCY1675147.1 LysM peptidoglycan-binding domain-containing protein [Pseudarthrobacter sp. SL88]